MARWNAALHPRDRRGRWARKPARPNGRSGRLVGTNTYIGIKRGQRIRVEHARDYRLRSGKQLTLKVAR